MIIICCVCSVRLLRSVTPLCGIVCSCLHCLIKSALLLVCIFYHSWWIKDEYNERNRFQWKAVIVFFRQIKSQHNFHVRYNLVVFFINNQSHFTRGGRYIGRKKTNSNTPNYCISHYTCICIELCIVLCIRSTFSYEQLLFTAVKLRPYSSIQICLLLLLLLLLLERYKYIINTMQYSNARKTNNGNDSKPYCNNGMPPAPTTYCIT